MHKIHIIGFENIKIKITQPLIISTEKLRSLLFSFNIKYFVSDKAVLIDDVKTNFSNTPYGLWINFITDKLSTAFKEEKIVFQHKFVCDRNTYEVNSIEIIDNVLCFK